MTYRIPVTVEFSIGSADVTDEMVAPIIEALKTESTPKACVAIKRFACNAAIVNPETKKKFRNNFELSAMRSVNVMQKLISMGITEDRIIIGEYAGAVGSDDSEAERSKNRKVEATVYVSYDIVGTAASQPQ